MKKIITILLLIFIFNACSSSTGTRFNNSQKITLVYEEQTIKPFSKDMKLIINTQILLNRDNDIIISVKSKTSVVKLGKTTRKSQSVFKKEIDSFINNLLIKYQLSDKFSNELKKLKTRKSYRIYFMSEEIQ
jgi:uncharacterized protein YcfL